MPHLPKTTRNCWSHSFGHGQTRKLWISVQLYFIIMYLYTILITCRLEGRISAGSIYVHYQAKMSMAQRSNGLYLLKKLSKEHTDLTSYFRMQVDLAAEVSISVSMCFICLYSSPPLSDSVSLPHSSSLLILLMSCPMI